MSLFAASFFLSRPAPLARFLTPKDIPALLRLEAQKWTTDQMADERQLASRIERWPELSIGSFDPETGEALASLFMRPIDPASLEQMRSWFDTVHAPEPGASARTLFGISLTSVNADAADSLFRFFWPIALRAGWRDIYLGSPIRGYSKQKHCEPAVTPEEYARRQQNGMPADPQLRYYYRRGFTQLVTIKPDYFPHPASLNYGALIRGRVPLSWIGPVWRRLPKAAVKRLTSSLAWMMNS